MELLPRHRLWYHNSHGRGDLGIEVAKIVGSSYQKDYMVGNDVSSLNIRYILVFMSTCQSTHKYAVLNPVNREYNVGQLQDLTPHRVYDFRAALDAQVYLGWDGDAFVRVLNAVNKDWPDSLRGRTIGDAIEELRDRVRVAGRSTENVVNHDAILRVVFADDSWGGKTLINKMEVAP
jgi:hypothetical protein